MLFADGAANIIFMVDKYSLAGTLHSGSQTCRPPNSLHAGLGNGTVFQNLGRKSLPWPLPLRVRDREKEKF